MRGLKLREACLQPPGLDAAELTPGTRGLPSVPGWDPVNPNVAAPRACAGWGVRCQKTPKSLTATQAGPVESPVPSTPHLSDQQILQNPASSCHCSPPPARATSLTCDSFLTASCPRPKSVLNAAVTGIPVKVRPHLPMPQTSKSFQRPQSKGPSPHPGL